MEIIECGVNLDSASLKQNYYTGLTVAESRIP